MEKSNNFYKLHTVFLKWHLRLEAGLVEDEIHWFMQELLHALEKEENDKSD